MPNHSTKIPFLDLVTPSCELQDELANVTKQCIESGCFVGGEMVTTFETSFAAYCQTKYCVGVGSGTDALRFALLAAGVGDGDTVLTVPNTFIATTEAISQAGAWPELVDVDEATSTMDPVLLREYLAQRCARDSRGQLVSARTGRRVAGVIPVHLYGRPADMDAIEELANEYNLVIIEDACQAHGAEYLSRKQNRWRRAGSIGRAAAFSFYPGKNLGACGEAGALTTDDEGLAHRARMLRDHGQARKYYHEFEGYNGRLDAMQAGFLSVKLAHLDEWNEQRRLAAKRYRDMFLQSASGDAKLRIGLPAEDDDTRPVYHLFVVRVPERDRMIRSLAEEGIGTGIHYPVPLHLQRAYAHLGYRTGDFPIAEKLASEIVSLPMFPGITEEEQARVVDAVIRFVGGTQEMPEMVEVAANLS